jgi:hypothetical protein
MMAHRTPDWWHPSMPSPTVLQLPPIVRFRLRGGYPSFTSRRFALRHRERQDPVLPPGLRVPIVEYWTDATGPPRLLRLRALDSSAVCQPSWEAARTYLQWIIAARAGQPEARRLLELAFQPLVAAARRHQQHARIEENEQVVPSTSVQQYSPRLISHKGTTLLGLCQAGYPVPDFCILTAQAYQLTDSAHERVLSTAINNLEQIAMQRLGGRCDPLVFAIRCAMPQYIPGLMPTYLNVGVTDQTADALRARYGQTVGDKIQLNSLRTMHHLLMREPPACLAFESPAHEIECLRSSIAQCDRVLLRDASYQTRFFIRQVRDFYRRNQDLLLTLTRKGEGLPAAILQRMVWSVRDASYPGVLHSRHSSTAAGMEIESGPSIFGEEIMTGTVQPVHTEFTDREQIHADFSAVYHFFPCIERLEQRMQGPVTIEFAVESDHRHSLFALLQLDAAELSGRAMLLSVMDLYRQGVIADHRVAELIRPYHLKQLFSPRIDRAAMERLQLFCRGISLLPRSAVTAQICFSATAAIETKRRGIPVCFCKHSFIPSDRVVMGEVDCMLSLTPAAIHVVTACRGYGVPAFLNLEQDGVRLVDGQLINMAGQALREGDWVTLSCRDQLIFAGRAQFTPGRFRTYIDGDPVELSPDERTVFRAIREAYREYRTVIEALETEQRLDLNTLIKIVQNDLSEDHDKAAAMVNCWFDGRAHSYTEEVLQSELGMHQDQHRVYQLLSTTRRIDFFKHACGVCRTRGLKGFAAGSFMLGRFLCRPQTCDFWRAFAPHELVFMLNEYVLFEKYLQLLNDVGERRLNRARAQLLEEGLSAIRLRRTTAHGFVQLKLVMPDWDAITAALGPGHEGETQALLALLQQPYGALFDYDQPFSINVLGAICADERIPLPPPDAT